MAWRIDQQLLRGELDNTVHGRVTGRLSFHGFPGFVTLNLRGDCAPDLAGCVLSFENEESPVDGNFSGFHQQQDGWVGWITASEKCKVHDASNVEGTRLYKLSQNAPSHWANTLRLEWTSQSNGPVVIQTATCLLKISQPKWTLSQAEYESNQEIVTREYMQWMENKFDLKDGADLLVDVECDSEGEKWKQQKPERE